MSADPMQQLAPLLQEFGSEYLEALRPPTNVQRMREAMRKVCALGSAPADSRYVACRAGSVECEWVLAPHSQADRTLVYFHGGGYIVGDIRMYRPLAARIAHASGCSVLNVEYRLGPENPYTAPRADAIQAIAWARTHGPEGARAAHRVFVGGDSAGGGLTIVAAQALIGSGDAMPDALVCLSAAVDLSSLLNKLPPDQVELLRISNRLFLGDADVRDPIASPTYGPLEGLPPILMQASSVEPAHVENATFADKARAAGVEVTFEVYPNMPHIWQIYAPRLPESQQAIDSIGRFLRRFD